MHDYHGTIPITHIDKVNISPSNYDFKVINTLCSFAIKTILFFNSKFCRDNLTSIESYPFHYSLKDLSTWAPLLRGVNRNGWMSDHWVVHIVLL